MNPKELEKCKRLPPIALKSVTSFGSYGTSKMSGQNWNLLWMLPPWQFQFRLAFPKHYGHWTAGPMARALPQLELDWKLLKACSNSNSIPSLFHSIPFYSISFPFPIPILTTCLWSVINPKNIDQFLCNWCQSLAFFRLNIIHVKKSKID